ncbi:hypothetical protein E2320_011751 [Naja naja]|nr:hypothetical protein E2320_011751 [Naja naja]
MEKGPAILHPKSPSSVSRHLPLPLSFPQREEREALKFEVLLRKDSVVGFSYRASSSTSPYVSRCCEENTKQNDYLKNTKEQTCGYC